MQSLLAGDWTFEATLSIIDSPSVPMDTLDDYHSYEVRFSRNGPRPEDDALVASNVTLLDAAWRPGLCDEGLITGTGPGTMFSPDFAPLIRFVDSPDPACLP